MLIDEGLLSGVLSRFSHSEDNSKFQEGIHMIYGAKIPNPGCRLTRDKTLRLFKRETSEISQSFQNLDYIELKLFMKIVLKEREIIKIFS